MVSKFSSKTRQAPKAVKNGKKVLSHKMLKKQGPFWADADRLFLLSFSGHPLHAGELHMWVFPAGED